MYVLSNRTPSPLGDHTSVYTTLGGIPSLRGATKQRPGTADAPLSAAHQGRAATSMGFAADGDNSTARAGALPKINQRASSSHKHNRTTTDIRPTSSHSLHRPSTAGKDERLVQEHRDKSRKLVDLWEVLDVSPEERQRSIGSSLVLAIPSWQNLQRIRQLIEHLEIEVEDQQARAELMMMGKDHSSYNDGSSYSAGGLSSMDISPASQPAHSTSSRVARHKQALHHQQSTDSLYMDRNSHLQNSRPNSGSTSGGAKKLNFSHDESFDQLQTPGVSPVKTQQQHHHHHATNASSTDDLAAYAERHRHELPTPQRPSAPIVVDASTTTELTPAEKMQRSLHYASAPPSSKNVVALQLEETEKRQNLINHATNPVDALFLLHCHRLIQIEENDAEAQKQKRMRLELAKARINLDTTTPDEDDENAEENHMQVNASTSTTAPSPAKDIVTGKAPRGMSQDDYDSLQNLQFEEELRRIRISDKGLEIPKVIYSLIAIQHEADDVVGATEKKELQERAGIESQLKDILSTKLDGPPARRLHRLLYTGQYRIEGEEKADYAFLLDDFESGKRNVITTKPLTDEETKVRSELYGEYNEDVAKLDEYDAENRVLVRVRQAAREKTELGNIELHEATFRTYEAQNEGDARDVLACEHEEFLVRCEIEKFSISTLEMFVAENGELLQRIQMSNVEELARLDELAAAAERSALQVEEQKHFERIPDRANNEGTAVLEEDEAVARENIEEEEKQTVREKATAIIEETMEIVQKKEIADREAVEVVEGEERLDIHDNQQGSMMVTLCSSAALEARKEENAATMIQAFGKRTINVDKKREEEKALEEEATLQERELAAHIVTRSFRRAGAKNQGLAFAAAAVAEKQKQERLAKEKAEREAKEAKEKAEREVKEARERKELERFRAMQDAIFQHYSRLSSITCEETNARTETLVEEGSHRLQLLSMFRNELDPIVTNERQIIRLVNEEAFMRGKIAQKEEDGRIEVATRKEVASDVISVITSASEIMSQVSE